MLATDPVSVQAATGSLHQWNKSETSDLSTDPASVGVATFRLILFGNHPIDTSHSCPVVLPLTQGQWRASFFAMNPRVASQSLLPPTRGRWRASILRVPDTFIQTQCRVPEEKSFTALPFRAIHGRLDQYPGRRSKTSLPRADIRQPFRLKMDPTSMCLREPLDISSCGRYLIFDRLWTGLMAL